jgi:exopolysaccharide biosynthesis predicted pyruvyltransferase EpsI
MSSYLQKESIELKPDKVQTMEAEPNQMRKNRHRRHHRKLEEKNREREPKRMNVELYAWVSNARTNLLEENENGLEAKRWLGTSS